MAQKCVHKACGKKFTDPEEPCIYHPGPPEFHEGQKGWQCCKPRVLTFDEFLDIPPCTTGKHSTVDENPTAPTSKPDNTTTNKPLPPQTTPRPYIPPPTTAPPSTSTASSTQPQPPPPETDSDESSAQVPPNVTCKRRGCGASAPSDPSKTSRDSETCVYHSGSPLFHEGSKGWTCCKRKVLEFDEFLKIEGCKTRNRHCFVGKKKTARRKPDGAGAGAGGSNGATGGGADEDEEWEKVENVRSDFYQSPAQVQATIYLKKVDKAKSTVKFKDDGIGLQLDLKTADGKRYAATWALFGKIDTQKSSFAIKGTKVDLSLEKVDGYDWTRLRMDEPAATAST